ncbi:acetylxylan esterase [Aestuariimicrobium ganziense]|uniref:acetylxylan esterase n=1 Tax=Aestuariimicrobium ganziense TaxID=2773677 RepID=UPI0019449BEE|nr:acetylxylan esterase [Aestuariimicrobium ganziense]
MAFFDKPLDELQTYWPEVNEPSDFEDFWRATIAEARKHDLDVRREKVDSPLANVEIHDITFAGYGGHDIRAWLYLPVGASGPLPTVLEYHGYSGGRGMPLNTLWASAGYAHLSMDTRGQGWSQASDRPRTLDPEAGGGQPGTMTQGIDDKDSYFYRRVFTDAFRLLEVAREIDEVDTDKIFVRGGSQGGGITIAVAGLAGLLDVPLAGATPDVPFLCHFDRAITLTDAYPYKEISDHLKGRPGEVEQVLTTLGYHDGVNFARRASCPTLFSVALMDQICPPSTVYAAFNAWGDPDQQINVYSHNGHEGGREVQTWAQLVWMKERLEAPRGRKRPRRGLRR